MQLYVYHGDPSCSSQLLWQLLCQLSNLPRPLALTDSNNQGLGWRQLAALLLDSANLISTIYKRVGSDRVHLGTAPSVAIHIASKCLSQDLHPVPASTDTIHSIHTPFHQGFAGRFLGGARVPQSCHPLLHSYKRQHLCSRRTSHTVNLETFPPSARQAPC